MVCGSFQASSHNFNDLLIQKAEQFRAKIVVSAKYFKAFLLPEPGLLINDVESVNEVQRFNTTMNAIIVRREGDFYCTSNTL